MRRASLAFLAFLAVVLTAAALASLRPEEKGTRATRTHHPRRTVALGLDGINEGAASLAAWYAAATPTTTTTTTTRPRSVTPPRDSPQRATQTVGCQYEGAIRAVFGAAGDWAVAIAWRESRCTPGVRSPTGCYSLFQICLPLHNDLYRAVGCDPVTQAYDPACNIAAAKRLYDGAGSAPWRL